MKAAVKTAWTADLREHPEVQGHGYLDYIDNQGVRRQCCLGRLCLLAVAAGVIPEPELHGKTYRYLDDDGSGESFNQTGGLPRKVAEWAGLPEGHDDVLLIPDDDDGDGYAIEVNDGAGMTFAEIADLAETNVPVTE